MKRFFHSLLSLMLVVATTLLVSCSSTSAKAPTTYTSEKIAQLQTIVEPIEAIRERMPEVENLIEDENWVDTVTMIHGPFGQLRSKMTYLSRSLLPKDQKKATELAKQLFNDLEEIDAAAKNRNYGAATSKYRSAVRDFDAFLSLIPKT